MQTDLKQKQAQQGQDSSEHVHSSFAKLKGKLSDVIDKVRTRAKESMTRAAETLTNFPSLTAQPVLMPAKVTGRSRQGMGKKSR